MVKLSQAEKKRRKEETIYKHSEHLLKIIWACRDNAIYNNIRWNKKDQLIYLEAWDEFMRGCMLADGRKWYNRLEKQFEDFIVEHGDCVKGE